MKKLFALSVVLLSCAALSAQTRYYGVDFSRTRVFGATETGYQFREVFGRINSLVIAEWSKYDPGKFLSVDITGRNISPTTRLNDDIDPAEVITHSSEYAISPDQVADMVRRYELRESEGTGLVIVGEMLDKSTGMGSFLVVHFDVATREVLRSRGMVGKARGFGLRNYWAGSLYEALSASR
ncbi:MAG: hypothetical protein LBU98_06100 [Alistipes sp.]|jgi:hypothetical protein|nr:hypothetical protein [Alistipes sp.]